MRGSIQQVLLGLKKPSSVITLDAVSGTTTFANSAATKSVSLVLGSGSNRMVVGFVPIVTATPSTIQFNGVNMTLAKSKSNTAASPKRGYIYYILEANLPVAGTYNFSVTPSAACRGGIYCLSLFGVAQSAPEATGEGSSDAGVASWLNNITTLTDGAWIFDCNCGNDRTFAPTSPQVERFDFKDSTATGHAGSSKEFATAGATTMGQTPDASTDYAQAIAAFAPA